MSQREIPQRPQGAKPDSKEFLSWLDSLIFYSNRFYQGSSGIADNEVVRGDAGVSIQGSNVFITDAGRMLVGYSTPITVYFNAALQVVGSTDDLSSMSITRWSNDFDPPNLHIGKSRGSSIGTNTIVQNGDILGSISFKGANGTAFMSAGRIQCRVDATPGAGNNMPGRLAFATTPDGSATELIRMTIKSTGTVLIGTETESGTSGRIQLGTTSDTTAAGGILLGTDVQLHRSAADILRIPDQVNITGNKFTAPTDSGHTLAPNFNSPTHVFRDSTRGADNRNATTQWTGGVLGFSFSNDAFTAGTEWLQVTGGHAAGVTSINFPNGTVIINNADVNGGTIDGTTIGAASPATGRFTTIESTILTGISPLTVASTTKVTNFNADLLDDQSGAYYLDSANFTGTNWTDLTDAGETTLHAHAASSVTNFHALIAAHVSMRT